MSRSGYSEDGCDYLDLYRGAVDQAINGKRGQQLLREMLAALDAMPEKVLTQNALEENGQYCALGVVGHARGIDMAKIDPENPNRVAKTFNIAPSMAREIAWINDDDFGYDRPESPENRWQRVRAWVVENLLATGTDVDLVKDE